MQMLHRTTRFARFIAALCALLSLTFVPALPGRAQNAAPRVYLLRGGDKAADDAVEMALREAGFEVIRGVESHAFDGSQAVLPAYDALVLLYNKNWQRQFSSTGLTSIRNYVANGGGLVTGERIVAEGELADITAATSCGTNNSDQTEYQQFSIEETINEGLPLNFSFDLGSYNGASETCFDVKSTASVFYVSSNGGGTVGRPGLVGWQSGAGRVASFSTLLSDRELANRDYRRLLQNTVRWAARPVDQEPPVITTFSIAESGQLRSSRAINIDLAATDAGSGVSHYYLAELVFNGDRNAPGWLVVQRSGWQPYRGPAISWTLDVTPGVHYMLAWVSDYNGNISLVPRSDFVSYQSEQAVPIAKDQIALYRIRPGAGQNVIVEMNVAAGDPDMYVWDYNDVLIAAAEAALPVESAAFVADGNLYQIEIDGFEAGSYTLGMASGQQAVNEGPSLNGRPRGRTINSVSNQPTDDDVDLPPLPALQAQSDVFLPLVWR
jgi:hypothetical protein